MAQGFSTRLLTIILVTVATLSGCTQTSSQAGASSPSSSETDDATPRTQTAAEAELDRRTVAIRRTLFEAAGAGAVLGGGVGGSFGVRGLISGVMIGVAAALPAATYVSTIQEEYEFEEQRLERVLADLDQSNEEAEAVIVAMRRVLEEQRAAIETIRERIATNAAAQAALNNELAKLRKNVATMEQAIEGADLRREQLGEARGIAVTSEASIAVLDPRLELLSRRITAMREIADALSERI